MFRDVEMYTIESYSNYCFFFPTETTNMYATAANNVIILSMEKRALLSKILS